MKNFVFKLFLCLAWAMFITAQSDTDDPEIIRNIVFLGATGNGKSTLCNAIFGEKPDYPFYVGHSSIGATEKIVSHVIKEKNIRLIDTPGFGDNRFSENHVASLIQEITEVIVNPDVNSSDQIDAFVLVERLSPRATTLRNDLERFKNLFGSEAFKSLIILIIPDDDKRNTADQFFSELKKMKEVVNILTQGKGESNIKEEWFMIWYNKNSKPGQKEELFDRITKLEPYTFDKFIEAEKELQEFIDIQINEKLQRETLRIKRELQDQQASMDAKIKETEKLFEKMREEFHETREKATKFAKTTNENVKKSQKDKGFQQHAYSSLGREIGKKICKDCGNIGALIGRIFADL